MNAAEMQQVLKAFELANRDLYLNRSVRGVRVMDSSNSSTPPVIQVMIEANAFSSFTLKQLGLEESFEFKDGSKLLPLAVTLVENEVFVALRSPLNVDCGTQCRGAGLGGHGSLGWIVVLDGTIGAISNWHVFCPQGNSTPYGNPVEVWDPAQSDFIRFGSLDHYDRIDSGINYYDYAFAALDSSSVATGLMSTCEDGSRYAYPRRLGLASDLVSGLTVVKVGARLPTCRTGQFIGFGYANVDYGGGVVRTFANQLYFTKMIDPGDSGSICWDPASGKVYGLNFATTDAHSTACPLYAKGWRFVGTRIHFDQEVPAFESVVHSAVRPGTLSKPPMLDQFTESSVRVTTSPPVFNSNSLPPVFLQPSEDFVYCFDWSLLCHESPGAPYLDRPRITRMQALGDWCQYDVRYGTLPPRTCWVFMPTGTAWSDWAPSFIERAKGSRVYY